MGTIKSHIGNIMIVLTFVFAFWYCFELEKEQARIDLARAERQTALDELNKICCRSYDTDKATARWIKMSTSERREFWRKMVTKTGRVREL